MTEQVYPEPTVGGLIFDQSGRLFLMRSHKWRDRWVVPGGHVEVGERLEDALRREVKEETGLDVGGVEFLCFQEFINDEHFWRKRHFIFFDYACRARPGEVTLNSEAEEYGWFSIDEALALPIEPYTRHAIEMFVDKRASLRLAWGSLP